MRAKNQVALEAIDKRLRGQGEDITREPLPRRWVDLLLYLDEQEFKSAQRAQAEAKRGALKFLIWPRGSGQRSDQRQEAIP